MKFISKDSGTQVPDLLAAAVLLFVILNLAVFLLRVVSVWRYGALFTTSGAEPLVIYPVWKALHGLPVYEWPLQYPFSLSIYNYLFYFGYAFFLRLAGTVEPQFHPPLRLGPLGPLAKIGFAQSLGKLWDSQRRRSFPGPTRTGVSGRLWLNLWDSQAAQTGHDRSNS